MSNMNNLYSIVIAVVLLAWIARRQIAARPLREERKYLVSGLMGLAGVGFAYAYIQSTQVMPIAYLLVGTSLLIGVGLGVVRARLTRVWHGADGLMRQGNVTALALWIVGILIHLGSDTLLRTVDNAASQLGAATVLLYLGLSLSVQKYILLQRAERIGLTVK